MHVATLPVYSSDLCSSADYSSLVAVSATAVPSSCSIRGSLVLFSLVADEHLLDCLCTHCTGVLLVRVCPANHSSLLQPTGHSGAAMGVGVNGLKKSCIFW